MTLLHDLPERGEHNRNGKKGCRYLERVVYIEDGRLRLIHGCIPFGFFRD